MSGGATGRIPGGWWVTYVEKDLDGWNALALAKSLRCTLTTHELCVLTSERVSEKMKVILTAAFDYVVEVKSETERRLDVDTASSVLLSTEALLTLSAWKCCTKRAVLVHSCSLVLKNCDELFGLKEDYGVIPAVKQDRGGVGGSGEYFSTSLIVLRPNLNTFKDMFQNITTANWKNISGDCNRNRVLSAQEVLNWIMSRGLNKNSACTGEARAGSENGDDNDNGKTKTFVTLGREYSFWVGEEGPKEEPLDLGVDVKKVVRFGTGTPWKLACGNIWAEFYRNALLDLPKDLFHKDGIQKYIQLCFDEMNANAPIPIPFANLRPSSLQNFEPAHLPHLGLTDDLVGTVSIIGLSCRLPGANNETEFWDLLFEGRDETRLLPPSRFFTKTDGKNKEEGERPVGYLKCPVEEFDAKFFEISRREAEFMDPQHRLLLHVTWEALEVSGINPHGLDGSSAAVFVGLWAQEYTMHLTKVRGKSRDFTHQYLGNAFCASAGRISHFLGLRGPSVVMEAGCASSLEGLHYACEALKSHETDLALAAGVNVDLGYTGELSALESFILCPDGKCKTFDESANGFARAEAAVVLVLKRTTDAVRDGDRILGVIRGSAVNHDGAGCTMGTPNALAQEAVIRTAQKVARIEPNDVSYVEAHGTGTPVGDPIEFHALNQVFGADGGGRRRSVPLLLGSVKTNIGHTEGASGVVGLLKVLLSMRHRTIPRHLHLVTLNPNIQLNEIPAVIPTTNTEWRPSSEGGALIAGVSSFGMSGTNVHVIVQEPPAPAHNLLDPSSLQRQFANVNPNMERTHHVLALSAKSEAALKNLATAYVHLLEGVKGEGLEQLQLLHLAFSAHTGRAHFRHRLAVIAKDNAQALTRLQKGSYVSSKVKVGHDEGSTKPKIAFLFTGQGSQYLGMAETLYSTHPVFMSSFDECAKLLKTAHGLDLAEILCYNGDGGKDNESRLNDSVYSQPAIFCIEICLARLWASFGIRPDIVLGHSVGEFAAAVVAGTLSLEQGMALVVGRSKLVHSLQQGAMMVLRSSLEVVQRLISDFENKSSPSHGHGVHDNWIDIAAVNSASEVVVSGGTASVSQFETFVQKKSGGAPIGTQRLAASHAFHSRAMDAVLDEYEKIARWTLRDVGKGGHAKPLTCKYISGTLARQLQPDSDFGTEYWLAHFRDPVKYADAFGELVKEGANVFVEIGPQPILLSLGMGSLSPEKVTESVWVPSIRKTEDNWVTILNSVAKLYTYGVEVDWTGFDAPYRRTRAPHLLPTYPWQSEKFWYKGDSGKQGSLTIHANEVHPVLGRRVPVPPSDSVTYYSSISLDSLPYIKDHKVADIIILPAASYLEALLAAGRDVLCGGSTSAEVSLVLENFTVESALPFRGTEPIELATVLRGGCTDDVIQYDISVHRQTVFDPSGSDSGKWKRLASARFVPSAANLMRMDGGHQSIQNVDIESVKRRLTLREGVDDIYEKLVEVGLTFGPAFKSVRCIWYSDTELLIETSLPRGAGPYVAHPIVLDTMFQACAALALLREIEKTIETNTVPGSAYWTGEKAYLPMTVQKCVLHSGSVQTTNLYVHCSRPAAEGLARELANPFFTAVKLYNSHGAQWASLDGVDFVQTTLPAFLRLVGPGADEYPGFFEETWQRRLGPREARLTPTPEIPGVDDKYTDIISRIKEHETFLIPGKPQIDALCYAYILRSLLLLGWNQKVVGVKVSLAHWASSVHVQVRHWQLLSHWFDILAEEGDVNVDRSDDGDIITVLRPLPPLDEIESRMRESRTWFEEHYDEIEYKLVVQCGEQLVQVLQGGTSVFSLLFPEGSGSGTWSGQVGAAELYKSTRFKLLHEAVGIAVAAQVKLWQMKMGGDEEETKTEGDQGPRNMDGTRSRGTKGNKKDEFILRVLEVGAGTGAATQEIRSVLDAQGIPYEYTFTDTSPLLLNEAKTRFRHSPSSGTAGTIGRFQFKQLDLELDPKNQGFAPGSYDVVLADNVLHATRDLAETLLHIRHLLIPGGLFVFVELLTPLRFTGVTFGLLDGWWRFTDKHVRSRYLTVDAKTWIGLLEENGYVNPIEHSGGFDYINIAAFAGREEEFTLTSSIPAPVGGGQTDGPTGTWLIFTTHDAWDFNGDGAKLGRVMGDQLKAVGKRVLFVKPTPPGLEEPVKCGPDLYIVNPLQPSHLVHIFKMIQKEVGDAGSFVEGILYLWGVVVGADGGLVEAESDCYYSYIRTTCGGLLHAIQALAGLESKPKLVVLTRGAQYVGEEEPKNPVSATVTGVLMVYQNEYTDRPSVVIDIDPEEDVASSAVDVFHQMWLNEAEHQVVFRSSKKYVRRLIDMEPYAPPLIYPNAERYRVGKPPTGRMADIQIVAASRYTLGPGEVEVKVTASALNFKDLLMAITNGADSDLAVEQELKMPKVAQELGVDFAGVVTAVGRNQSQERGEVQFKVGDRVFGLLPGGALASHVVVLANCVYPLPQGLSFEAGSTLPCAYITALYFMVHIGHLVAFDRVLIHAAAGGVGLAAVHVAKAIGADIFATAGSARKRRYLSSLGIRHIYDSRSTDYGAQIRADTGGAGVTIVLNSLTGPGFKEATLGVLAEGGRFLEMSKLNVWREAEVKGLRPDVHYFLQKFHEDEASSEMMGAFGDKEVFLHLSKMLLDGLASGQYVPLSYTLFPLSRVHDAFAYLQEAKHIGKVVLRMPETEIKEGQVEHRELIFSGEATYMITGGLGGIGLEVAKWIVNMGARYLVLVGRSPATPHAEHILLGLRAAGATVTVHSTDVSDRYACKKVLDSIRDPTAGFPPLKGIMHAAGVTSDGLMVKQKLNTFMCTYNAKVQGTINLHSLTLDYGLEHFVLFSSVSSAFGAPGQSNHCSANKYLDSFARFRVEQGLPCCSVNWGAWSDVGTAAGFKNLESTVGMRHFTPVQGIASLQRAMLSRKTNTVVLDIADMRVLKSAYNGGPYFELLKTSSQEVSNSVELEKWIQAVKNADLNEREGKIRAFVEFIVRDTLRLSDWEPIDPNQDMREMGIDSLMAMELRSKINLLEINDAQSLSIHDMHESRTVNKLTALLYALCKGGVGVAAPKLTGGELRAQIESDVLLPDDIALHRETEDYVPPATELQVVLLTGATGYLGPYILEALLRAQPTVMVYCLIRAKSNEDAWERLKSTLDDLDLLEGVDVNRLKCVAGNVSSPSFGLDPPTYDALSCTVDSIIHCAAQLNLALPYGPFGADDIRTNNVIGLLHVLRFATTGRAPKPLQFASSIYALSKLEPDGSFPDRFPDDNDYGESLSLGYQISKFVCEKLLKAAAARGLPVTILRHHFLTGDSRTGLVPVTRNATATAMWLVACQKIGKFPDVSESLRQLTGVPVDVAAVVSVRLFLNRSAELGVYNVNNPKTTGFPQLMTSLRGRGFQFDMVPYNEWREAALGSLSSTESSSFGELFRKDLLSSDVIMQQTLMQNVAAGGGAAMTSNSPRLRKYVPDIDDLMVDTVDMLCRQLDYLDKTFGKGNMKAFLGAGGSARQPQ